MARKATAERDLLHTRLRIEAASDRKSKVSIINEWASSYLGAEIPRELLEALGRTEWSRGWTEGVNDANDHEGA